VREAFTDTCAKKKKFIPGMGHYKNEPAGHNVTSKSASTMRRNPHMVEKA